MKKLLFFLFAVVMTSCNCIMSQSIPTKYLYVDESCGAAMPDLRLMLEWRDNCGIDTVEQTPTPGTWLTVKYTTVHIRAFDTFRNYTDVLGSVELIDTIPPELVKIDSTLIADAYDKASTLYDQAERIIARQDWWNDSLWPDSIPIEEDYANYYLVCYSSPLYAFRDVFDIEGGQRVWTFAKPGTTITFPEQ